MTNQRFGFERTVCACDDCSRCCRFMPGMLIPDDINAIAAKLGYTDPEIFAKENLLASPGATVVIRGKVCEIPTLVPQRRADGACKFLTEDNKCSIHEVAPYGCAFFDTHQTKQEGDRRSQAGLYQIIEAWGQEASNVDATLLYACMWFECYTAGLRAERPAVLRARIDAAQKGENK